RRGEAGGPAAGERTVELREQGELLGTLAPAELLDRPRRLVRQDDPADVQTSLHVGIALDRADHAFSQTETCLVLSMVNGSRSHPPQRSRSRIPAMRAIR